ncbi:DUF7024 domain-containing protein, partial [Snodgrassella alvi]|uniref:DUF7024 domain-containing protein n=1 Tax=Snodgrassella alvi TaxID=1196083 RepID=UPI0015D5540E
LANNGINAGQSIFHRYALYSIAPLIAYFCANFSKIFTNIIKLLSVIIIAILVSYYYSGPLAQDDHFKHKIWTQAAINKLPSLYNPYPDIYIQRTFDPSVWNTDFLILTNRNKNISKIIFSDEIKIADLVKLLKSRCLGNLTTSDGLPINISKLKLVHTFRWTYLNTELKCHGITLRPPMRIYPAYNQNYIEFNKDTYPDFVMNLDGFSLPEEWGTWIDGKKASLTIDGNFAKNVIIKINMHAFESLQNKEILVNINGIRKNISINDLNMQEYKIDLSFKDSPKFLHIEFFQPDAYSPASKKISNDTRVLGIGIHKLEWVNHY